MQNRQLKRFIYTARHRYLTMNNVVLAVAGFIAVSLAWSSVGAIQRNYALQREVDDKKRQLQLVELQTENQQYEQKYYKSREYLSLEAKRRLGLAEPGEKVLILPPNSVTSISDALDTESPELVVPLDSTAPPPMQQWLNFLFGGNRQGADESSK